MYQEARKYSPMHMKTRPEPIRAYLTDSNPVRMRKSNELNIIESPKITKNMFLCGEFRNRNKAPKEDVIKKLPRKSNHWLT